MRDRPGTLGDSRCGTIAEIPEVLAFKWIRIVYRCWKTGSQYDESVYLQALARHDSPLITAPGGNESMLTEELRA
jgi:hypothetical protein